MLRKCPCGVCGTWYRPDARLGQRQHTCGSPSCRREWHRRSCKRWHKANPDYDRHTRLLKRLLKDVPPDQRIREPDPLKVINWVLARAEIGLKIVVLVEETAKVLLQRARDAIPA